MDEKTNLVIKTEDFSSACEYGVIAGSDFSTASNSPETNTNKTLKDGLKLKILERRKQEGKGELRLDEKTEPKNYPLTKEDLDNRERRKAANRKAAQKCRDKMKIMDERNKQAVKGLMTQRKALNATIAELEKEIADVKFLWRLLSMPGARIDLDKTKTGGGLSIKVEPEEIYAESSDNTMASSGGRWDEGSPEIKNTSVGIVNHVAPMIRDGGIEVVFLKQSGIVLTMPRSLSKNLFREAESKRVLSSQDHNLAMENDISNISFTHTFCNKNVSVGDRFNARKPDKIPTVAVDALQQERVSRKIPNVVVEAITKRDNVTKDALPQETVPSEIPNVVVEAITKRDNVTIDALPQETVPSEIPNVVVEAITKRDNVRLEETTQLTTETLLAILQDRLQEMSGDFKSDSNADCSNNGSQSLCSSRCSSLSSSTHARDYDWYEEMKTGQIVMSSAESLENSDSDSDIELIELEEEKLVIDLTDE